MLGRTVTPKFTHGIAAEAEGRSLSVPVPALNFLAVVSGSRSLLGQNLWDSWGHLRMTSSQAGIHAKCISLLSLIIVSYNYSSSKVIPKTFLRQESSLFLLVGWFFPLSSFFSPSIKEELGSSSHGLVLWRHLLWFQAPKSKQLRQCQSINTSV